MGVSNAALKRLTSNPGFVDAGVINVAFGPPPDDTEPLTPAVGAGLYRLISGVVSSPGAISFGLSLGVKRLSSQAVVAPEGIGVSSVVPLLGPGEILTGEILAGTDPCTITGRYLDFLLPVGAGVLRPSLSVSSPTSVKLVDAPAAGYVRHLLAPPLTPSLTTTTFIFYRNNDSANRSIRFSISPDNGTTLIPISDALTINAGNSAYFAMLMSLDENTTLWVTDLAGTAWTDEIDFWFFYTDLPV